MKYERETQNKKKGTKCDGLCTYPGKRQTETQQLKEGWRGQDLMKNINAKHFNTRLINQIGEQMEVKSQDKDKQRRIPGWKPG